MQGKVVSTKMDKTVLVEVERLIIHPMYKKRVRKTERFAAHNELEVKDGDFVEISETRPYSKTKRFIVARIIEQKGKVSKK